MKCLYKINTGAFKKKNGIKNLIIPVQIVKVSYIFLFIVWTNLGLFLILKFFIWAHKCNIKHMHDEALSIETTKILIKASLIFLTCTCMNKSK